MSNEFMREERYIVFKISDLGNSLKGDEIRKLAREYAEHRQRLRKKPLECVVVEKDWPEYEPTWKAIEARVTGAQSAPSIHEFTDAMALAFHAALTDGSIGEHEKEEIKAGLRAALAAAPEAKP